MSELPSELAALSKAAGEDGKRRALDAAIAIVALVDGGRYDAAVGAIVAAALALVAWCASARWLVAAIALCVTFPLAARAGRRVRLRRLQRQLAVDPHLAWRRAEAAWARATPGQRAALMLITKTKS